MAVSVICPACDTRLLAGEQMVGKQAECPQCHKMIDVNAAKKPKARRRGAPLESTTLPRAKAELPHQRTTMYEVGEIGANDLVIDPRFLPRFRHISQEQTPSKSYGSIFGIDLTRRVLFCGVLVVSVVAASIWYLGPWRQDFWMISVEEVDAYIAVPGLTTTQGPSGLAFKFGGNSRLVTLRPQERGGYVIIHAELSRALLQQHEMIQGDRIVFDADRFELRTVNNIRYGPVILVKQLVSGEPFDFGDLDLPDYRKLLPPSVEPSDEQFPDANHGYVEYDGIDMIDGKVDFTIAAADNALNGEGWLYVHRQQGIDLDYRYAGSNLRVTWSGDVSGWYVAGRQVLADTGEPGRKWPIMLLFERPVDEASEARLHLDTQRLATFDFAFHRRRR